MRRFFLLFGFFSCGIAFFGYSQTTHAAEDFQKMSPTVEITSFEYTKNDAVIPVVQGSGTILRPDGLILTNNHVVEKEDANDETYDIFSVCFSFSVPEKPTCEYTATLLARNRAMDTALLKLDPTDIRGNKIPALPFLSYDHGIKVQEGASVQIFGFPGIGLDTITITKGQVSGFEKINTFQYVKTDTTIAPGNSGGTALGADGKFLGIPTYGISTFGSSLGYFLDINEAVPWITAHKDDTAHQDAHIREELSLRLRVQNDARRTRQYQHPFEPMFTWQIPSAWKFEQMERNNVIISSEDEVKNYRITLSIQYSPFPLTAAYLEESVFQKIEKNKENYTQYTRRSVDFHGVPAYLVTYLSGDVKSVHYLIPYGGAIFFINYEYDLKQATTAEKDYTEALQGFAFSGPPKPPVAAATFTRTKPAFRVASIPHWYLLENNDPQNDELFVQLLRPDNVEGEISLHYMKVSESEKQLSLKDLLQKILKNQEGSSGFRLVNTSEDVIVDGIHGISLTYIYEGEDLGKPRKVSKIYLPIGDYAYYFEYDDLSSNYDKYVADFETFLRSFTNLDTTLSPEKGVYVLGSLNSVFSDISAHRYEQAIAKLAERGIVEGFSDTTFRPEKSLSRTEMLKIIVAAKANIEKKQGKNSLPDELQKYADATFANLDFADTKDQGKFLPYLRFARTHKMISGAADGLFHPTAAVNLAEACKMLAEVFTLPVWQPLYLQEKNEWYKPYLDKGFELGFIPYGLYTPDHILTRGEMAAMVSNLIDQVEGQTNDF